MRLKNVVIVVKDLERSKAFYRELFGLEVILEREGNVMLTEGLVLQDGEIWKEAIKKNVITRNHAMELYFEERDMKGFARKLAEYGEKNGYGHERGDLGRWALSGNGEALEGEMPEDGLQEQNLPAYGVPFASAGGKEMIRIYDPDGHLIEVGFPK